jgi:ATP-dependent Clp protease adaptor protein ClpS
MSDSPVETKREEAGEAMIAVEEAPPKQQAERSHKVKDKKKPQKQPNYHVIIWNDEEHTYEYVIELLMTLFAHSFEAAFQITHEVDHAGKGIAFTCHMELAELKRDMVLAYGADWRMPKVSKSSIRATIEPAPE